MVVHTGPPVVEHYHGQVECHVPHLPHVLFVDQLVEFWDKFRDEEGAEKKLQFFSVFFPTRTVLQ
jgi:hypothetical protein